MKALLIIDIQNDYFPGGASELVNPVLALDNTVKILKAFRESNLPVIHVQHNNIGEGDTFMVPGTDGVKIHERLASEEGEYLVTKTAPSAFYKTDLIDIIRANNITELVVCGMMTHMCIDTTVRCAMDHELPVTLISDACATKALTYKDQVIPAEQVHASFLAALSGTFAELKTASEYLLDA